MEDSIIFENTNEYFPSDYHFNLSDFALFLSVMRHRRAYECVLSIFLEEPDIQLQEVKVEQVVLNRLGKRAIRLDAWAMSEDQRQLNLPSTVIIFITQDDIFKRDLAKYTFTEQCEEIADLKLEDGTKKIFLNMASKNGSQELISLLQYMKETRIDNPNILVKDSRILELDTIVTEVKESEEWEAVQMNILEVGIEAGIKKGEQLKLLALVRKKHNKGCSPSAIADALEESEESILQILELLKMYPDRTDEQLLNELK